MARRSSSRNVSGLNQVNLLEAESDTNRINLKLTYPVRYIHNSTITGERYEWNGAGSVVSVHADDVANLLAKYRKNGCCGASPQKNYIFVEVN
jgi:hypothetical protein